MIFGRGTRMMFGPSKRHEATRYIAERGSGGWKKHGNRISSSTPASRGYEDWFLPSGASSSSSSLRSSLAFVRFAILTASLIKLLRKERFSLSPVFCLLIFSLSFSFYPRFERPWPLGGAEIAAWHLARRTWFSHKSLALRRRCCLLVIRSPNLAKCDFQRQLYISDTLRWIWLAVYTYTVQIN